MNCWTGIVFHLSSSAPPRLCASQGTLWRISHRGRDDLRPVRLNASTFQVCSLSPKVSVPLPQSQPTVAPIVRSGSTAFHLSRSAPPRLCASQGTLWRIFHAGGTTSASSESPRPVRKYGKWDCPFWTTTGRSDPNSLQGRRPRCPHWALPAQNLRGSA